MSKIINNILILCAFFGLFNIYEVANCSQTTTSDEADSSSNSEEQLQLEDSAVFRVFKETHGHFFKERVPVSESTSHFNRLVWERVTSSESRDIKILAIGFENKNSGDWGDEGEYIHHNTEKCSQIIFLSGGFSSDKHTPLVEGRVSVDKYNHIYADFDYLEEDVPYMLDCHFFDYILVGCRTYMYMTKNNTLKHLYNMLNENGRIILPATDFDLRMKLKGNIDAIFAEAATTPVVTEFYPTRLCVQNAKNFFIEQYHFAKIFDNTDTDIWSQRLKNFNPMFETFFYTNDHADVSRCTIRGFVVVRPKNARDFITEEAKIESENSERSEIIDETKDKDIKSYREFDKKTRNNPPQQ